MRFKLLGVLLLSWGSIFSSSIIEDSTISSQLKEADQLVADQAFSKAYPIYQQILPYFEAKQNWYYAAYTRLWMGECIYYEGRYQEALDLSLKADEIIQEHLQSDTLSFYAMLLQNIGVFYSSLGDFGRQMKYYLKLHQHALAAHGKESPQAVDAYFSLGMAYGRKEQWGHCLRYLDTSLILAKSIEYKDGVASAYQSLAHVYAVKNDCFKAIEFQKEALGLLKAKPEIAAGNNNLGMYYMEVDEYQLAEQYLLKALRLRRELHPPYHDAISSILLNLCSIHFEANAMQKADSYLNQAIETLEKAGRENNVFLKVVYNYKSAISLRLGRPKLSEQFARKALVFDEMEHRYDENSRMSLANALLAQDRFEEALGEIQQAINQIKNPQSGELENINVALDFLDLKVRILQKKGQKEKDPSILNTALESIALVDTLIFQARNTYHNRASKKILAKNAHGFYAAAIAIAYELYQQLKEDVYLEMAFKFAEKNKSMLVAEKLNDLYAKSFAGIPKKLLAEEKKLLQEIAFYSNLLEEAKQYQHKQGIAKWEPILFEKKRAQEALLKKMEREYAKYYELKYRLEIPSLELILSQLLKPNEILLEYFLAGETLYVILLSKEEKSFHRLIVGPNFIEQVDQFRQSIYKQDFKYGEQAFAIYEQILQPLEEQIKNKDLLIVPDGIMGLLPFEALLSKRVNTNKQTNYKDLPYLLKQHQFRYYFSAGVAFKGLEYSNNRKKQNGILAFAPTIENLENSTMDSTTRQVYQNLENLDGTLHEVSFLEENYPGKFLFAEKANEKMFKELGPHFRLLHIASHAIINNQLPTASKLVFSPKNVSEEDGLLNVFELYNMELFADLAVLSACNTGIGQITRGDGVASLARAFAYAGCPNLVMSLWKVKDKTTPKLIKPFYRNLAAGLDKSAALHTAKLQYLNKAHSLFAHPYYWSGLIYVGDRETLILKKGGGNLLFYFLIISLIGLLLIGLFKLLK